MASAGKFEVTLDELPDGRVVARVTGELDMATTPQFESALDELDLRKHLVIDLSDCTFLDSSAVRVLSATAREAEAAGGTLSLVTSDSGIRRVLEIAALDTMLPVYESVDTAF